MKVKKMFCFPFEIRESGVDSQKVARF